MQQDSREVTFQRVVSIVERRTTVSRPEVEYGQDGCSSDWYNDRYTHQDSYSPDWYNDRYTHQDSYSPDWYNDRCTHQDKYFLNFKRNSSPPPPEEPWKSPTPSRPEEARQAGPSRQAPPGHGVSQTSASLSIRRPRVLDELRGIPQLSESRSSSEMKDRWGSLHSKGQFHGGMKKAMKPPKTATTVLRVRRDPRGALPTPPAGFEGRGRSFSPDRENSYTYQQLQQRRKEQDNGHYWSSERPRASSSRASRGPKDTTSPSLGATQECRQSSPTPPSFSAERPAPDQDCRARRASAIASKALELEGLYARDCQTFSTVVKLLVEKQPSLEEPLHAPLRDNLMELKQRCLEDLRLFIKELDQPNASKAATRG